jgi:hypothetical protein
MSGYRVFVYDRSMAFNRPSTSIFISYAKEDRPKAEEVFAQLKEAGLDPWLDTHSLLPGENWKAEIERAIRRCDLFICLLSKQSASKRGILQVEIGEALAMRRQKLQDDIYIIPIRLEECDVPEVLRSEIQYVDIFASGGWTLLFKAIRKQEERLFPSVEGGLSLEPRVLRSKREGRKSGNVGYDCEVVVPNVSGLGDFGIEINAGFRAFAARIVQDKRKEFRVARPLGAGEDLDDWLSVTYEIGRVNRNVISVAFHFTIWESIGAHPYYRWESRTFSVPEQVPVGIADIFGRPGFDALSKACEEEVARRTRKECEAAGYPYQPGEYESPVQASAAMFEHFVIEDQAMMLLFDSEAVLDGSHGAVHISVPLERIRQYINPDWLHLWE